MKVDVYGIGEIEGFGPIIASFEHDFLLNPGNMYRELFPRDGIGDFTNLFFPEDMRKIENDLKRKISIQEIKKSSSLSDKLSKSESTIKEVRRDIINKYGVSSSENSYMVMIQDQVENMSSFLKYVLNNSRDVFVTTHNARPVSWDKKRLDQISFGVVGINSARVETMDPESQTYTGKVFWFDRLEKCNPTSEFIAHPLPEEAGFRKRDGLFVRDTRINPLTGGYHFTLLPEFDKAIEIYVNEIVRRG
ncbi:MAG: hypothetical protein AABW51_03890 [Nanoarchaeota archaeon]